jgi:hypothetical protein
MSSRSVPSFFLLLLVLSPLVWIGCGPGDLSLRARTDRAVPHANVTVQYLRGEEMQRMTERIPLNEAGEGELDLRDDVTAVFVSLATSQPRDANRRSALQRPGSTTLELLNGGDVIDTSTGMLPSVSFSEDE